MVDENDFWDLVFASAIASGKAPDAAGTAADKSVVIRRKRRGIDGKKARDKVRA